MATIASIITTYSPSNNDVGVPLRATVSIVFSERMNETRLSEDFFLQGPDTDQYVGPGLLELRHPNNFSQGDIDDFLESPGYTGLVAGTITFQNVDPNDPDVEKDTEPYVTKLIFTPTNILAAKTEYTATLGDTLDYDGNSYDTPVTFSFTTGSGSIEQLPSDTSTSVLSQTQSIAGRNETENVGVAAGSSLELVTSTPKDESIEIDSTDLVEIVLEMNKALDSSTINTGNISIKGYPIIEHPNLSITYTEDIAFLPSVDGRRIILKV